MIKEMGTDKTVKTKAFITNFLYCKEVQKGKLSKFEQDRKIKL